MTDEEYNKAWEEWRRSLGDPHPSPLERAARRPWTEPHQNPEFSDIDHPPEETK